jgi:hypothetical protein
MGYTSYDNMMSELAAGKKWKADFIKLYAGGIAVAGNWYDLTQGNGNPAQYLHGNLVKNADFVTSLQPWEITTSNWAYTPATHLMTRTANADFATSFLQQTLRMTRGQPYMCVYTISGAAGTGLTLTLGGTAGTTRTTNATFREVLVCGSTDKLIKFSAPSGTGGGTVDLVSVQPIYGGFIPYNDLTEGAFWHGGDVSPDTKHLINEGAWTNAATGVASVLILVDVLGVYPRVRTDFAGQQSLHGSDSKTGNLVHDCQVGWNEQTPANTANALVNKVTEAVTGGGPGASCVKLTVSNDTFATGIVGSRVVALGGATATAYNFVYAKYIYAWVRSTINLDAGDISFCTDETASLASSQDTLLPALVANTWTRVRLDVSAMTVTDKDTIISIGMKVVVDKNQAFSVYWDDVRWANWDGTLYNGTFLGNADGWSVNGTWAYRTNDVERTAGADGLTLEQTLMPVTQKCPYRVTFTIANRSAGSVTVSLGGGAASAARSTDGTYEEIITCGTTNYTLAFTPDATFNGRISHVICTPLIPRCDVDTLPTTYGGGVRMYYVIDNALGNGANASTTVVKYTNQAGATEHAIGATVNNMASDVVAHLPHSGVGAGKYGPFLPLQAGDYGIQKVDMLQFSAAQATADGAVDVVVCKFIASIPLTTAFVAAERDYVNQLPSFPDVRDGACLMLLHHAGAVTASGVGFMGYLDFGWS